MIKYLAEITGGFCGDFWGSFALKRTRSTQDEQKTPKRTQKMR
jgi:hypothetical protein